jgi:hypothetical protein
MRGFYDAMDHAWLVKCVEHRIGDRRVVRHIRQWLKAGVLEDGQGRQQEEGTPQGGSATPPTILQTFFFRVRSDRDVVDPEDHVHLLVCHVHPLYQSADQLPLPGPIRLF